MHAVVIDIWSYIFWRNSGRCGLFLAESSTLKRVVYCLVAFLAISGAAEGANTEEGPIRVGIIGLDTSHALAFTKVLNQSVSTSKTKACRVTAAYPQGSPDIESSKRRIPTITQNIQEMGVEIVSSIDELLTRVDAVLLETNDGRPHLEQAIPVLKSGKRVFIDKPMGGSLADVIAIFNIADHYETPVFTSSTLRFAEATLEVRNGGLGKIRGCTTYGPCTVEKTHPDMFWYGIHGIEALFTMMGTGCQSVSRSHSEQQDILIGTWDDGRFGVYRGFRDGTKEFGGTAFANRVDTSVGRNDGYKPLVHEIARFFQGGAPPVSAIETIEIYAFMEAADRSKEEGGRRVLLKTVIAEAREAAERKGPW